MRLYISDDGQGFELRLVVSSYPFTRIVQMLKRWRYPHRKRVPGLLAGAFQVSDDFDDPLPEDFLISSE